MDFYAECEKQKSQRFGAIGDLAYRRQKASVQIEEAQRLVRDLDIQIAAHEEAVRELERSQRNFNSWLAIRESAMTTEQLAATIRDSAETENGGS